VLSGKGSKFPQSEGLAGGNPGAINDYVWVHSPDAEQGHNCFSQSLSSIPGEKEAISWGVFPLMGNDALYVRWNGGGGVGDPLDRDPHSVLIDVTNQVISIDAAREIFGVQIQGQSLDVDGTANLRISLRKERFATSGGK
jgi:N-methylhydantoinase B